ETLFPVLIRIAHGTAEPPHARAGRRRSVPLPLAFDGWFERAAATRPEDRFASASGLVAALAATLGVGSRGAASQTARMGDTVASPGAQPATAAHARAAHAPAPRPSQSGPTAHAPTIAGVGSHAVAAQTEPATMQPVSSTGSHAPSRARSI